LVSLITLLLTRLRGCQVRGRGLSVQHRVVRVDTGDDLSYLHLIPDLDPQILHFAASARLDIDHAPGLESACCGDGLLHLSDSGLGDLVLSSAGGSAGRGFQLARREQPPACSENDSDSGVQTALLHLESALCSSKGARNDLSNRTLQTASQAAL